MSVSQFSAASLVLVMPPAWELLRGFTTGLYSLANYVSRRRPTVCVDVQDWSALSVNDLRKFSRTLVEEFRGDGNTLIVGITVTTATYQAALMVAKALKSLDPEVVIVFGGAHASADAATIVMSHPNTVDLVIVGEGEKAMVELMDSPSDFSKISGAVYVQDKKVQRVPPGPLLTSEELDQIPFLLKEQTTLGTPGKFEMTTYVSARGCPLPCAFCSVAKTKIRSKTVPAVKRDIRALVDQGFTRISIEDNFFAHSISRTREICQALVELRAEMNLAFEWDCQTRVESLARPSVVSQMKLGGCSAVYIGLEALNPKVLRYLNKTGDPENYLQLLERRVVPDLLDAGIEVYLNLQLAVPGFEVGLEPAEAAILERLSRMAEGHKKAITIFPQLHVVYPGTRHFFEGVAEGRFSSDVFEAFTAWEFEQLPILRWLGESFAHGTGGLPEGILDSAALKDGRFAIKETAVESVKAALERLSSYSSIRLFRYGAHLVEAPVQIEPDLQRSRYIPT